MQQYILLSPTQAPSHPEHWSNIWQERAQSLRIRREVAVESALTFNKLRSFLKMLMWPHSKKLL